MGILFTITMGILFTTVLGIQFTISSSSPDAVPSEKRGGFTANRDKVASIVIRRLFVAGK